MMVLPGYCVGLLRLQRSQHGVSEAGGVGVSSALEIGTQGFHTAISGVNLPLPYLCFLPSNF